MAFHPIRPLPLEQIDRVRSNAIGPFGDFQRADQARQDAQNKTKVPGYLEAYRIIGNELQMIESCLSAQKRPLESIQHHVSGTVVRRR